MSKSTCIMVIGLPRSGTSATAGLLHHAGVCMERKSMGRNTLNPRGYYEDLRWQAVNKAWTGKGYALRATPPPQKIVACYRKLAAAYQSERLWGMKSPRLCLTAPTIWTLLDEVRVVVVLRDFEATVRSLLSHSRIAYKGKRIMSAEAARAKLEHWRGYFEDTVAAWDGPRLTVRYEDLIADPLHEARRLCAFASEATGVELDPAAGAAFVDPSLDHGGRHPKAGF